MTAAAGAVREHKRPLGAPFRTFQVAVLGSDLADGVYRIAVPLLALSLTSSPLMMSAVGIALRAPWVVATLPAGVLADRHDPLRLMRLFGWLRVVLTALLCALAVTGHLPAWGLVVAAFLVGMCGTVVDVAAQAGLPGLVAPSLLPRANANLQSGQTIAAQLAGPALGGLLAFLAGGGIAVAGVMYVAAVLILHRVADGAAGMPAPVPGRRRSMVRELREGASAFSRRSDLILLAGVAAAGNLGFSAVSTLLPLWAVSPGRLGLSPLVFGLVMATPAIGGLAAGTFAARALQRFGPGMIQRVCAPAIGACFLLVAVPHVAATAVAMTAYGAFSVQLNVMSVSHRQSTVSRELFGRVNAVYRWVVLGVTPVGSLVAGLLAVSLGTAAAFLFAGLVATAAGLAAPFLPGADQLSGRPMNSQQ